MPSETLLPQDMRTIVHDVLANCHEESLENNIPSVNEDIQTCQFSSTDGVGVLS